MTREPVVAQADSTLGEFADSLSSLTRHSTYPVVSDGEVLGLLPFAAVDSRQRAEWDKLLVRDNMIGRDRVPVLDSEDGAEHALEELIAGDIGRALVVKDGQLAGILSLFDLQRALDQRSAFKR